MEKIVLKASERKQIGSRAMVGLRAQGRVPVNIYGHKQANRCASIDAKEITGFVQAGHRIVTISVDGSEENGVLKEVQYDSLGTTIIHVDIARVDIHEKITIAVQVETRGMARGVNAGGNLDVAKHEILLEGPALEIPEKVEIDITALDIGQSIRIKDLKPVPNCRFVDGPEVVVVSVLQRQEEVVAPVVGAAAPEMPAVIAKKKDDGEAAEGDAAAAPAPKKKDGEGK